MTKHSPLLFGSLHVPIARAWVFETMTVLKSIAAIFYWLFVGALPIAIFRFGRKYAESIGCPASGDCYAPGSEHLLSIDILFFYAVLVLWPVAVYKLGWHSWRIYRWLTSKT